jgi:hypothetical protein
MPPEQSLAIRRRLVVELGDVLPSRFEIVLVPNSATTKHCEVGLAGPDYVQYLGVAVAVPPDIETIGPFVLGRGERNT